MAPLLTKIPMACLYGVFLYMGFSSLKGVQFFDRIKLLFIPKKYHPGEWLIMHLKVAKSYTLDYIYLRHVPVMKVHLFTFIQICGLSVLWIIKSTKPVSIVFPLMVAAIVGIRMVRFCFIWSKIFTRKKLTKKYLDIRLLSQGLLPTRAQLARRHYSRSGKTRKRRRKNWEKTLVLKTD